MKLYYDRRAKDPIYYAQQGFRNGKKTTTRNVKKFGKHSELLKITDDPLGYVKEEIRKMNEELVEGRISIDVSLNFEEKVTNIGDVSSKSTASNIGYFFLQDIYRGLRIKEFIESIVDGRKITFECNDINRFLVFSRILDPQSKRGMWDDLQKYFERPSFGYQHILRFMDVLEENYDAYIKHLFSNSKEIVSRDTSVCYFDCTNFYFEAECEDYDYVDEVTGEIKKGLRKYGPSKEHRPNPIVQMGLFMDGRGIPLSMCINPGSSNEQICAIPLEKELTRMFGGKRFIYCADGGLGSLSIRQYNAMGGRAFIVTQSIKKLSEVLKQAVFSDCDYKMLSNDKPTKIKLMKSFDRKDPKNLDVYNDCAYKVIVADHAVDVGLYESKRLKNGKVVRVKSNAMLRQKIIVTFSRKAMEYQRYIRNRQIERARSILKLKDPDAVKKGPHDVMRFVKRTSKAENGEVAADLYELNEELIAEEEKFDGYYAVATNLDDNVKEILEISSQRYKIEDCFRVLKTNFSARPVYHYKERRIIAHFLICYTALLIYRLLECKLDDYGTHFTTGNIIETLCNMNVANFHDLYYASMYTGSETLTSLNAVFNLGLDKKYYQPKELHKKLKQIRS